MSKALIFIILGWLIWKHYQQQKALLLTNQRINSLQDSLSKKIDSTQLDQRLTGIGAGTITQTDLTPYNYLFDYNQNKN